ncbi:bifunctional transcriptional activator/DNA repair enzyme AdaA [Croceicoccus marinus]|uniref:methylated-DNA--[protein]-cysteine S-methyltransferase n=1 Tax=Croceicoccus marinus TaxID=450378 RepID=A0A1Z1FC30_9SPHN|nr:methylated-DNA--[protein]-cysteine S-methyltransferase [Croceicoccus marinus]ARU16379.1 bifunctional transcriptional activator/DNA repair enzyme protein Ada [Croceicoccus marinus]
MTQALSLPLPEAEALAAFVRRDRSYDGRFVVGVRTTGIYCRPSCPARRPRPENLALYPDIPSAQAAGLRACKRCLPDDAMQDRDAVRAALDAISGQGGPVPMSVLAERTGYSPDHLARIFRRAVGLSPAGYGRALRLEHARDALGKEANVTDAILEAGYETPSRFYDEAKDRLGMTPSAWHRGGEGVTIRWAAVPTPLGDMLVAATDKGICRLSFGEGVGSLAARFPNAELVEGGEDFADLLTRVIAEVEAPGSDPDIPLDVKGTAFQERIWAELRHIPPGETRSYAQLAAAAGHPKAVRAAGSANGANNVAVLIPCHRVVRSDGSVGGYAYGPEIKIALLEREKPR